MFKDAFNAFLSRRLTAVNKAISFVFVFLFIYLRRNLIRIFIQCIWYYKYSSLKMYFFKPNAHIFFADFTLKICLKCSKKKSIFYGTS